MAGGPVRTIRIKVIPRARTPGLSPRDDGSWVARVAAPPVDGKANEELVRLVARHFGCPARRVWIKSGEASRTKVVCIEESP